MTVDVQGERPTSGRPAQRGVGPVQPQARAEVATSAAAPGRRPPIQVEGPGPAPDVLARLRAAGVPPRFEDRRLGGFRTRSAGSRAALAAALEVVGAGDRNLVLTGPPGTGKTHLATGILAAKIRGWLDAYPEPYLEELLTEGGVAVKVRPPLECRFVVVPSFLDRLRAAARYAEAIDPLPVLFDVDVVVLDDLGAEKATDWASERLYVLVNERYNRRRSTIVTTNASPNELADRGYGALVSRLLEDGQAVAINAPDWRRSKGGEA